MSSITEVQMQINLSKDAKLSQIYGKNKFSTVIDGDIIYLMSSTHISKYNVIAMITSDNCQIVDRDKANIFVDWSHEHFGNPDKIESLSNERICNYIMSYLEPELTSLITFSKTEISEELSNILNRFSKESKEELFTALSKAELFDLTTNNFNVPYTRLTTKKQMEWAHENMYTFIFLNADNATYDCCSREKSGAYNIIAKNGRCGSWKQIEKQKDNAICLIFDQTPLKDPNDEKIDAQVREDICGSSYKAANKFIILEEKFSKSLNEVINVITAKQGVLDLQKVHYPDVNTHAENIAKIVRAYNKLDETNFVEKEELTLKLKETYKIAYEELQKSQDSLKELHELAESLN